MRMPGTTQFFEQATRSMADLQTSARRLQAQVGTGERLTKGSDDPVAAARLRTLSRADRMSEAAAETSGQAASNLALAGDALASASDLVIQVRVLATQARTGTLSDTDRARIGDAVAALGEQLLDLANARDLTGNALFAGSGAGPAYLAAGNGGATYAGSGAAAKSDLGEGQGTPDRITGPEAFAFTHGGAETDLFATIASLATALRSGGEAALTGAADALSALDTGLTRLGTAQTVIGARQAWVETLTDRRAATGEYRAEEQARYGGADLATTISRLQETMTVLEASQASFVKLSSLSLFAQLR